MPLTLDPVHLSNFVDIRGAVKALDIGTGNGIISLILAQRLPGLQITGIDINPKAVALSATNFHASPFSSRLKAVEADFFSLHENETYDLIISNPPFYSNGLHPLKSHLAVAKHDHDFSWPAFFQKATNISNAGTRLYLIFPESLWDKLRLFATVSGWYVRKWRRVVEAPKNNDGTRILAEWGRIVEFSGEWINTSFPEPETNSDQKIRSTESMDLYLWQ